MCKSIKDCLFCRCPPTSSCCARKWSQDATKQARNSSQHRIRDFGVGLLAVPVERSKTRNLVELILNRDLKTIFLPEVVTQLEQLRDEIAKGQYELQNGKAENPTVLAQHLQQLRQQRQKLQDEYLPVGSGFKFEQFQKTLDERTAIIEWYIASDRILAFVIKPHGQVQISNWELVIVNLPLHLINLVNHPKK